MQKLPNHKRGDTFAFIATFHDLNEELQVGMANSLRCQFRDRNRRLWAEAEITETDVPGDYLILVPASITRTWPLGTLWFDIELNDNGVVTSSETMSVNIIEDITYNEV